MDSGRLRYRIRAGGGRASRPLRYREAYRSLRQKLGRHPHGKAYRLRRPGRDWSKPMTRRELLRLILFWLARIKVGEAIVVSAPPNRPHGHRRLYSARKVRVKPDIPPQVDRAISWSEDRIGTPYILGGETDRGFDCSWQTRQEAFVGTGGALVLAHYTTTQFHDPRMKAISWADAAVGDFMFLHDSASGPEHVATIHHKDPKGRGWWVIDQEPSDAPSPDGGMLGTGLRIRPAFGNYYCNPSNLVGVRRWWS